MANLQRRRWPPGVETLSRARPAQLWMIADRSRSGRRNPSGARLLRVAEDVILSTFSIPT